MVLSLQRWVGKVAIVTGASSGIGAALAEKLVEEGLIVVGFARRVEIIEEHAEKLSGKKGKLYAVKTNLTNEEDILKSFKWVEENLGAIHILINNAGYMKDGPFMDGKTEVWKKILDVNVLGLCIATREAMKIMTKHNINGHIIHVNSIAGQRVPLVNNLNVYPASKFAVTALTETLRQELTAMKSGIKITSVSPGLTKTEMTTYNKEASAERLENIKSRPILDAEDIADGIIYALSTPEHVQIHELTIKPVGEPH